MSPTSRTFRLLLSSTFSDFQEEREALQKKVFPKLERYCADSGARFQAVDLRWGNRQRSKTGRPRDCFAHTMAANSTSLRPTLAKNGSISKSTD